MPGETPVAILGEFPRIAAAGEDVFAAYRQTGLDLRTPVTYGVVAKSYIRDKLGYNMRFATDEEIGRALLRTRKCSPWASFRRRTA